MTIYERSCRLCLKDLFGPGIDCLKITELKDAINILFDVKIEYSDITRCICNKCFENVMGYKAFKKTISECQQIIRDYEIIRKKVLANHQRISIKEEVIDLSDEIAATAAVTNQKQNRKRPVANSVTDSQIHNILNIVHDKATPNGSAWDTSTPVNGNKKAKLCVPMIIKSEPVSHTTPPPTPVNEEKDAPTAEEANSTVTSTSNDKLVSCNNVNNATSNILPANDKRSESTCSTSTSGIASFGDVTQNKEDKSNSSQEVNMPDITPAVNGKNQAITNGIHINEQTTDETNNNRNDSSFNKSTRLKTTPNNKKDPTYRISNTSLSLNEDNGLNNSSGISSLQQSPANASLTEDVFPCPECPIVFKLRYRFNQHLQKIHKYLKEEINKLGPVKRLKNTPPADSRARSVRQAKSQALKKFSPSQPKRSNSSSPIGIRRSTPVRAVTEKDNITNQKVTPATPTGELSTVDDCRKTNNPVGINSNNRPDVKAQPAEPGTFNGKRIITITLLRTKNSVNFRYCDQHKQHIDFNTVTPEELEDIRNSLMLPEIWGNLNGVFKDSPPDKKTIDQLKTIFGDNFPM